ncbi:MAG: 6-bladed beta-propeller [Longimicrobiales bacterium]
MARPFWGTAYGVMVGSSGQFKAIGHSARILQRPTMCSRLRILAAGLLLLGTAACVGDRHSDGHVRQLSFSSAKDTVVLENRDDHVVAELTDLLEWRGDLVIVDAKENNIKAYDASSGGLVSVLGRRGTGPGEFVSLVGAVVTPDGELAVLDALLHRVTVFGGDGEVPQFLVRSRRVRDGDRRSRGR